MCLVVDLREHPTLAPKIAEEDIEVLKILKVIHNIYDGLASIILKPHSKNCR